MPFHFTIILVYFENVPYFYTAFIYFVGFLRYHWCLSCTILKSSFARSIKVGFHKDSILTLEKKERKTLKKKKKPSILGNNIEIAKWLGIPFLTPTNHGSIPCSSLLRVMGPHSDLCQVSDWSSLLGWYHKKFKKEEKKTSIHGILHCMENSKACYKYNVYNLLESFY